MILKTYETSGADERSPSRPQYFSWINNTNEGSTEAQTLTNIDFFSFMRDTFGMQLDIYAWDAGNLDGSKGTYADFSDGKLKKQFPTGYGKCVEAAKKAGFRLGVWGGADGYGDTEESEAARRELIVSLCRDFNFAEFKFDTVCGSLRPEKREAFIRTMKECRKYSPDLVLLNHRNDLGEADLYSTTFLWEGVETYVDVHVINPMTCPHHRGFIFTRGNVPDLMRLTEDHGVCISSCVDYFEDDLIYQAFGRSLILAPEIYGNPWLMRDDELPVLANIYNLHRRYREILVDGIALDKFHGADTVSRGDDRRRFITTGNPTWSDKAYTVRLDESIGLSPCEKVAVILHHPTTRFVGKFDYSETVDVNVRPFRACLIEVCDADIAEEFALDCDYEVVSYRDGKPELIKLINTTGEVKTTSGRTLYSGRAYDSREWSPIHLGTATDCDIPTDSRTLYETTCFALDNDSLEMRELRRSGPTKIPEVQAARDAFFNQFTYKLRGSDSSILFDGDPDSMYDCRSKTYFGGLRVDGGCLRVDFGEVVDCDAVEIEYYYSHNAVTNQIQKQIIGMEAEISCDLVDFRRVELRSLEVVEDMLIDYVRHVVHDVRTDEGLRMLAKFGGGKLRYFELPEPVDRIFCVRLMKDGVDVTPKSAFANNMMAAYSKRQTTAAKSVRVTPTRVGRLAVAVNGRHGVEGVYCGAKVDGCYVGFGDRSPSYPSNVWEHYVRQTDGNTTHYLDVTEDMVGREVEVYALFNGDEHDCDVEVYLCPVHGERVGEVLDMKNNKE